MANTKSAQKNIRKTARATARNRMARSKLKTLAKNAQAAAADPAKAKDAANAYIAALDKAAKTGVIHPNKVSRHKAAAAKILFAK